VTPNTTFVTEQTIAGRPVRVPGHLLAAVEERGLDCTSVGAWLRVHDRALYDELHALGIGSLSRRDGTGHVAFHMIGPGGAIDREGLAIPAWVRDFLQAPSRSDLLAKLESSGARQRDVFIGVTLQGARGASCRISAECRSTDS
jgi:hypothetical protein